MRNNVISDITILSLFIIITLLNVWALDRALNIVWGG